MTEFAIGRVGLAVADGGDGYTLAHPFAWQQQGRTVQLQGAQVESTQAGAVGLVDRINGLDPSNNPDETAIPVYSATVTELNGYFAVLAASATLGRGSVPGSPGGTGFVDWQVTLGRQATWRRPVVEIPMVMDLLTNGWAITTSSVVEAVPGTPMNWVAAGSGGSGTRSTERGSVSYAYVASRTFLTPVIRVARYVAPTEAYYRGCAYVEDVGGHGLTHVGRGDFDDPSSIRIGNGLVRLTCAAAAATLTFQWWNGSSWVAGRSFSFGMGSAGAAVSTIVNATILKNAPDECIVRYFGHWSNVIADDDRITSLDVSVRRGERVVRIYMDGGSTIGSWMGASSAMNSTLKGYGLRSSSTINSEYIVLTSNNATTTDFANGRLSTAAGPPSMFGIGVSSGGGTGTGIDDADGVAATLFLAQASTQRVVVA